MNQKFSFDKNSRLVANEIPEEAAQYASQLFAEISEELAIIAHRKKTEKAFSVADITHTRHVDLLIAMMIDEEKTLDQAITELQRFDVTEQNIRFLWKYVGARVRKSKQKEKIKAAKRMHDRGKDTKFISKRLGITRRTAQRYLSN
ncbi:hypothetical protein [Kordiimonas sp. SCSIO 12610]|uniref:hypothetical protein n=1 Tax=Kordiimonas sp. SCSIO 12610 TaxID=2829597 RepID=UPI00210B0C51|nr:hypothetical protein [Kordiimonas sp. SCSIO 12610]UTW53976.1 hypothetical protein KFF44_08990 [Kordiimonas sp. SCSIO 12610]